MIVAKQPLDGKLPLELPYPCPICGKRVYLDSVNEWGTDDGEIIEIDYACETEPDIDSPGWRDWHNGHYSMPYVDWLPWEGNVFAWLNRRYTYTGETKT